MKDEEHKPHSKKKKMSLAVEVVLVMWMTGIFLLNLLIFTPPIIWSIAGQLSMTIPLTSLHGSAQRYFLTTDFSEYSVYSDPFWNSIPGFK